MERDDDGPATHDDFDRPLFEDVPDDIDETWPGFVAVGGMASRELEADMLGPRQHLQRAASTYRWAGDALVEASLNHPKPWETLDAIMYVYRHALELYLKALIPGKWRHDLVGLVEKLPDAIHAAFNQSVNPVVMDRLREFAAADNVDSTVWRYPEVERPVDQKDERVIDLRRLKRLLGAIFDDLDKAGRRMPAA